MLFELPATAFNGIFGSHYVYLYSAFSEASSGFEEWAFGEGMSIPLDVNGTVSTSAVPPGPSLLVLLGGGLLAAFGARRRRRDNQ